MPCGSSLFLECVNFVNKNTLEASAILRILAFNQFVRSFESLKMWKYQDFNAF